MRKKLLNSLILISVISFLTLPSLTSCDPDTEIKNETHNVSVKETNGVEIDVDKKTAKEGETVTISVNVTDTTKEVSAILINGSSEGVSEVTKNKTYTFIMIDKDVTIEVTLKAIGEEPTLEYNIDFNVEGEVNIKAYVSDQEVTKAKEGDRVTLKVKITNDTKTIDTILVNDGEVTLTSITENEEYFFIMPKEDVTISITLKDIPVSEHNITVNADEHVLVKTLINGTEVDKAKANDKVTLTLDIDEHYSLSELTVSSGNVNIELETVKLNEEYSFIMPSEEVTISVTTTYIPQAYKVLSINNIDKEVSLASDISVGTSYFENTDVTLEITYSGNRFDYFKLYVNNEAYDFTPIDEYSSNYTVTFKMPTTDINLTIAPFNEEVDSGTIFNIEYDSTLVDVYGITDDGSYNIDNYSYVYFYIVPKDGVAIDVTYKFPDDYSVRFLSPYEEGHLYRLYNPNYEHEEEVNLTIEARYVGRKTVTIENGENVTIEGLNKDYNPGDIVNLYLTANDGYVLNSFTIETESGKTIDNDVSYDSDYDISFEMPEENVIITLEVVTAKIINVTPNEFIAEYYFEEDDYFGSGERITSAIPGTDIRVYATPVDGYEISNIYYQENLTCDYSSWSGYWTFTCPTEGEINIVFEVVQRKSVTYTPNDEVYSIEGLEETYLPGDEVEFEVYAEVGYKITGVTTNVDGLEVTQSTYGSYSYSFVMPDNDVEIIVQYEQVETGVITFTAPDAINYLRLTNEYGNEIYSGDTVNVGETITLRYSSIDNGYILNDIKVNGDSIGSESYITFTMPSGGAEITFDIVQEAYHNITLSDDVTIEGISLQIRDNDNYEYMDDNYAYVGHEVTAIINLDNDDYYLDPSLFKITTASGQEIEFTTSNDIGDTANLVFTMPDEEVVITPATGMYQKYNVTFANTEAQELLTFEKSIGWSTEEIDISGGIRQGINVRVNLSSNAETSNNTYKLLIYETGNAENIIKEYSFYYGGDYINFTMPSHDITVELVITPKA